MLTDMQLRASYLMHKVSLDHDQRIAASDISTQSEQSMLAGVTRHVRHLSPASFRGFLPPDFVYSPLQSVLHRSLAKGLNVIVRWSDILRQVSRAVTSGSCRDPPSATLVSQ